MSHLQFQKSEGRLHSSHHIHYMKSNQSQRELEKLWLVVLLVGDEVGDTQVPQASRQLSLAFILSTPFFLQRPEFFSIQLHPFRVPFFVLYLQVLLFLHEHVLQASWQLAFAFVLSKPVTLHRLDGFLATQLQSFCFFVFQSDELTHECVNTA